MVVIDSTAPAILCPVLARFAPPLALMGLIFFLMIVTLIPFALGPDLNLLSRIGPAILWIAALLATLIGLDRLFQARVRGDCPWFERVVALADSPEARDAVAAALLNDAVTAARFRTD